MTLLTERLPQFQSLSIGVWVNAGTRHELPSEGGLSHFLEHMMFKGTSSRTALEIARAVDQVGGEFNAFTAREYTCFHILLLAKDLSLATEILSDVLLKSTFAAEEIEKERKVIQQEISMVEDNPEEVLHDKYFEKVFGGHSLGKPILGTAKSVGGFDRDEVYAFFKKHYSPHRMIVSVAGDVQHNQVRRELNRHLGRRLKDAPRSKLPNCAVPRVQSFDLKMKKPLEQSHVLVGFPGVSLSDPRRYALALLNVHLGGGMSSVLFQEIREKRGMAYAVYSSMTSFTDVGLFNIYLGTSAKEVPQCLTVIGQELKRVKDTPLSVDQLSRLKKNLKSTLKLNEDSVENRMSYLARSEMTFQKCFSLSHVCRMIDKVSAAEIQKLANGLFQERKLALTTLGPQVPRSLNKQIQLA